MAGFGSRLKTGMVKLLGLEMPSSSMRHGNSIDVNAIKYAMQPTHQQGFSQPVWAPELSTVGAYSREGYTSKSFDTPTVSFKTQALALETDEDVQLAINHLSSQITGGEHYWKSQYDEMSEYMQEFSTAIDFDWLDTIIVKELLWYGNSFWKPRMGIARIQGKDDLMHIPISSSVRIWWDRQRKPYKIEFRGSEYQGYHNPEDVMHFIWNPVDASAYGTGFGTAMTSSRDFEEVTPSGEVSKRLPSLLNRKYSTQMTMHITERRYIPHNVYKALGSSQTERDDLAAQLADLRAGEDFVVGNKVEVQELASIARAFDPTLFSDLTMGAIFKALNDFRGKQAGESQHTFANAKQSAILDEIGLAAFPLAVTRQLQDKLFKPWYAANPINNSEYGGGIVTVAWDDAKFELNFGRVEKKDIPIEQQIKLLEVALSSGSVTDPLEIRQLLEDAGLAFRQEYTDQMQQEYHPAIPQDTVPDPFADDYSFDNNYMGEPPNALPYYDQAAQDIRGTGGATEPIESMEASWNHPNPNNYAQPSNPYLNFLETQAIPNMIKRRKFRKLSNAEKLAIVNIMRVDHENQ